MDSVHGETPGSANNSIAMSAHQELDDNAVTNAAGGESAAVGAEENNHASGNESSNDPLHQLQDLSQPYHHHNNHSGGSSSTSAGGGGGAAASDTPENSLHSLSYAYQTYLRHDVAEQNHWDDVCRSYRQYATYALAQWANHQYRLHALVETQRSFLPRALRRETSDFLQRSQLFKEAAMSRSGFPSTDQSRYSDFNTLETRDICASLEYSNGPAAAAAAAYS